MASTITPDNKMKSIERTPNLDQFGKDLTMLVVQNKLDPVIGRDHEIKRCCQILARKKKNNPLLIGEAGVGKTNIAYGIAQRIANRNCPRTLYNKRVILLDISAIVAGTMYRGQFEERLKNLIDEVQKNKEIILFIDEVHTLIGAGAASGAMDMSNIFKPALADGTLQTIGATTLKEFREHLEDDSAMTRRFQTIYVDPTSIKDTITILNGIKGHYEKHHNVKYTDEAIEACVKLSDRYITDRVLPDKAIDLLDESGANANIYILETPDSIKALEDELKLLAEKKAKLLSKQDYEALVVIRDDAAAITAQIEVARKAWEETLKSNVVNITVPMIEAVVTEITGIPVAKLQDADISQLNQLENSIKKFVVGQDSVISKIAKAIKRSRVGLKNPGRPISFLSIGKTGIGKTLLAKVIAKEEFGSDSNFIRIDMSEYTEKFNVSKLIGAPPGYVGYEKGGDLTEKVRRKPYSVVLLDELEKAHPDVYNILLQILDDGHITDGLGRKINFKNTIIIMTSNVGAKVLQEYGVGAGFITKNRASNQKSEEESVLKRELEKKFSPEFLNRIGDILIFNTLTPDDIAKIVSIELNKSLSRASDLGIDATVTESARKFLAEIGFDEKMGARPLERAIQTHVEDLITDHIIERKITAGSSIIIDREKDGLTLRINK